MKIKRIVSLALVASMCISNFVYADQVIKSKKNYDQNNMVTDSVTGEVTYEKLTVEQATQKAIAYSPSLKKLTETIDEQENANDTITHQFEYLDDSSITTATTASNRTINYSIRQLSNALRSLEANTEIAKEGIELSVQQLFNSIKAAEENIKLYEENMVIQDKNIKIAEVKKNLGLISQLEYDNTVNVYKQLETEKNKLQNSVESAYRSLNELMGASLDKKYTLVHDEITFEKMPSVDLDAAVLRALNTAEVIKSAEDAAELADWDQRTYSSLNTWEVGTYDSLKNAANQAARAVDEAKTNLSSSMKSLYEDITETENTYTDTLNTLEVLKSQYNVIKTQYEMGKATEIDLLTAQYNIHKAEAGLDQLVRGHDLMVKQFQNPDLIQ